MKYLAALFIFILAHSLYSLFNMHEWHLLQPFLIGLIFLYLAIDNIWLHYSFAFLAGLLMDSFSAHFGLYSISLLCVVFLLKFLQSTIFTSKNTGTIIALSFINCFSFWVILNLLYFILPFSYLNFTWSMLLSMIFFSVINAIIIIFLYLLYFNLWLKRNERRSI